MKNSIFDAVDSITADDTLKENTLKYLNAQRGQAPKKSKPLPQRFALAAAAVVILVVGIFAFSSYTTEAAYLDIDVNPSIELTLNNYDRVIGAYAYNEDGEQVLAAVDIHNKTSEEAMGILIDAMIKMNYIKEAGLFTATLQEVDGQVDDERLSALQSFIDSLLQDRGITLKQEIFFVDGDTKSHAHDQNMTPAKYLAILELQQLDPTVTFDSCRDHSIGEIKQQTHEHESATNHDGGSQDDGAGDGGGHEGDAGDAGATEHASSDGHESSVNASTSSQEHSTSTGNHAADSSGSKHEHD